MSATTTKRAYGSGSLEIRQDKYGRDVYYGRLRAGGRQTRRKLGLKRSPGESTGLTKRDAERALQNLIDNETTIVSAADRVDLKTAGDRYLERLDQVMRRKATTLQDYEIILRKHDALGLRSHRLAARATDDGRFEREIIPIEADGELRTTDQGIRRETTLEALAALKPAFEEDGTVTAGNSSQISDGAATVLLMARDKADALALTPRAGIFDTTTVGVDPVMMLTGPIPATRTLLERNGMTIGDVDLIDINEAFASVVCAWRRELEPDMDCVNVNGGALALGHPLGSSGARLLTTLLHELERSEGELGLVTMCTAGDTGTGTLIQRSS
jgi:acetyl-CoA acetyltransferase family protein